MVTREVVRERFVLGDYRGAIDACDRALGAARMLPASQRHASLRSLLNEKARCLRNLGEIGLALDCYIEALENAHAEGSYLDAGWQLALFGKVFGKYLQRQTLFFACLREAEHRFAAAVEGSDSVEASLVLRHAIIQDLLGSYFRRVAERDATARQKCLAAYRRAIELHRRIQNPEGISRATCHFAFASAHFAKDDSDTSSEEAKQRLREALLLFETGLRHVLRDASAGRGRATRRAQQAEIYLLLEQRESAQRFAREAVGLAQAADDPRALMLAKKVLAQVFLSLNEPASAAEELEAALKVAGSRRFAGFERQFIANLAPTYLGLGDPERSVELLIKLDQLTIRELDELDTGFSGAIAAFRKVAPDRADRYLVEGQLQDHQTQTRELIELHDVLRRMISRHERHKAARLQAEILRFSRTAIQHALKNHLNEMVITVKGLRKHRNKVLLANLSNLVDKMLEVMEQTPQSHSATGNTSLMTEIESLAKDVFPGRVNIERSYDVVFHHLVPELLREALRHLLENAQAAIARFPPETEEVLYLEVTQERRPDSLVIRLSNPGDNPPPDKLPAVGPYAPLHGFQNAYWFFSEALGLDCSFSQPDEGPRSQGRRTNCVTITVPENASHVSIITRGD